MYKRILVACDGSAVAERALHEALKLVGESPAVVRILHVVDTAPPTTGEVYVDFDGYRRDRLKAGQEVLDDAAAVARDAGIDVEPALREADGVVVSDVIVAEAGRWSAELIVMGTHGRGGLMHLLMGSVAEGVIRHAPVPLLLTRGAAVSGEG